MTAQATLALPDHGLPPPVTLAPDPVSAAPTDEIAAWVDAHQRAYLIQIYSIVDQAPLDVVAATLRSACLRGFGIWMEPPKGDPAKAIRPATHLIEIALFGVTGVGTTLIEAAHSWRIAARRALAEEEST